MPRPLRSEIARAVANVAIETGDPGRMAKARRLHRKGAVSSVEIDARAASTSVIEDDESFVVELNVTKAAISGEVPSSEDLLPTCDCDDDGDAACRHILAGLLGLAEAFEVNPRLLDEWTDTVREVAVRERPTGQATDFFGEVGRRRPVPVLPPRAAMKFPPLIVEDTDAGPVFEDAVQTIRDALTQYQVRR